MRPKATSFKRKEAIRRKNHDHWSKHKGSILAKRTIRALLLEQSQTVVASGNASIVSTASDRLGRLSLNSIAEHPQEELDDRNSNQEMLFQYLDEIVDGDDELHAFPAPSCIGTNADEEENTEDVNTMEENCTEEQMRFAEELFRHQTAATPIREYDEVVYVFSDVRTYTTSHCLSF